jgi:hypothetical protein
MSYSTWSSSDPASSGRWRWGFSGVTHEGRGASTVHGVGWQNCTTEVTIHQTDLPEGFLTEEGLAGFLSSLDRGEDYAMWLIS